MSEIPSAHATLIYFPEDAFFYLYFFRVNAEKGSSLT